MTRVTSTVHLPSHSHSVTLGGLRSRLTVTHCRIFGYFCLQILWVIMVIRCESRWRTDVTLVSWCHAGESISRRYVDVTMVNRCRWWVDVTTVSRCHLWVDVTMLSRRHDGDSISDWRVEVAQCYESERQRSRWLTCRRRCIKGWLPSVSCFLFIYLLLHLMP